MVNYVVTSEAVPPLWRLPSLLLLAGSRGMAVALHPPRGHKVMK